MKLDFYIQLITRIFYKYVFLLIYRKRDANKNELYIYFKNHTLLEKFFKICKNNSLFQMKVLIDICVVDYYNKQKKRFEFIYNFTSITYNFKFFFKIIIGEFTFMPSITKLYSGSSWLEREIWDLFGIYFYRNMDLRRILADYGFNGHPLRKDFPLTGYVELRYNDCYLSLHYEDVELSQDYRIFSLNSPWEITGVHNYSI